MTLLLSFFLKKYHMFLFLLIDFPLQCAFIVDLSILSGAMVSTYRLQVRA